MIKTKEDLFLHMCLASIPMKQRDGCFDFLLVFYRMTAGKEIRSKIQVCCFIYYMMPNHPKDVSIIHGTADSIIPLSNSKKLPNRLQYTQNN